MSLSLYLVFQLTENGFLTFLTNKQHFLGALSFLQMSFSQCWKNEVFPKTFSPKNQGIIG